MMRTYLMHFEVVENTSKVVKFSMRAYGSNRIPFALLDYSSKKNSRHMLSKNFKQCMKKHERHCVKQQILYGKEDVA